MPHEKTTEALEIDGARVGLSTLQPAEDSQEEKTPTASPGLILASHSLLLRPLLAGFLWVSQLELRLAVLFVKVGAPE